MTKTPTWEQHNRALNEFWELIDGIAVPRKDIEWELASPAQRQFEEYGEQ